MRLKSPSSPWPIASCSRMPGQPGPSTTSITPGGRRLGGEVDDGDPERLLRHALPVVGAHQRRQAVAPAAAGRARFPPAVLLDDDRDVEPHHRPRLGEPRPLGAQDLDLLHRGGERGRDLHHARVEARARRRRSRAASRPSPRSRRRRTGRGRCRAAGWSASAPPPSCRRRRRPRAAPSRRRAAATPRRCRSNGRSPRSRRAPRAARSPRRRRSWRCAAARRRRRAIPRAGARGRARRRRRRRSPRAARRGRSRGRARFRTGGSAGLGLHRVPSCGSGGPRAAFRVLSSVR